MPRYFFDVHDGVPVTDDVGTSCPDLDAAKREARRLAADFVARPRRGDDDGGAVVISVRDAPGGVLATVWLGFVVEG